jgi:selenium-binding protein 1
LGSGRSAGPDDLSPALKPFGAVPPLISDIDLSVDDRWLYVSCSSTGELEQYDVSDPFEPRKSGMASSAASSGGSRRPPPGHPPSAQ